jgi:hypothetical protein
MYDVWRSLEGPVVNPTMVKEAMLKAKEKGAVWDGAAWSIIDRAITIDPAVMVSTTTAVTSPVRRPYCHNRNLLGNLAHQPCQRRDKVLIHNRFIRFVPFYDFLIGPAMHAFVPGRQFVANERDVIAQKRGTLARMNGDKTWKETCEAERSHIVCPLLLHQ